MIENPHANCSHIQRIASVGLKRKSYFTEMNFARNELRTESKDNPEVEANCGDASPEQSKAETSASDEPERNAIFQKVENDLQLVLNLKKENNFEVPLVQITEKLANLKRSKNEDDGFE